MNVRELILIKHSMPEVVPDTPAHQWRLSDTGHTLCEPLAVSVAAHQPAVVVSSCEPKAEETATLIARQLAIPAATANGLHEHDRRDTGFLGHSAFEAAIAEFFERPTELVFGRESADQSARRFSAAVAAVLQEHRHGNIALVAHGTVIALFVARHTTLQPFDLWHRLGLPSYVVLSLPDFRLLQMVENL